MSFPFTKPGIHLRQRQAEAWCRRLSPATVDSAINRATCLRGYRDLSHRLSVDQSEASPRNFPFHVQYGWNMPRLTEVEKHSLVRGALMMPRHASTCLRLNYIPGFPAYSYSFWTHTWQQLASLHEAQT